MKINRTIERAILIQQLLSKSKDGLTLNEICKEIDIPKSSCFDIVETLVHYKILEVSDRGSKLYSIGINSFIIGSQYIDRKQIIDIAKPKMEQIGEWSSKSVFLAQDCNNQVVYTYKYQPQNASVVATCTVGTSNEYFNTALGKCMLAFKEDYLKLIDDFVLNGKIGNVDDFLQELSMIQKNKFSLSNQQHQKQLFCIAVPVYDSEGKVNNAISLSGLYVDKNKCDTEVNALKSIAEEISREIGYTGVY